MNLRVLAGTLLLAIVFGSLHAFSVLTVPLQHALGGTRAQISWSYAFAIVALTAAVYTAPYLRKRQKPAAMAATAAVLASAGLLLAGLGGTIWSLVAGYGLMFGFANGIAYSLFLDRAAASLAGREGFAIGVATATYGGGAIIFAPLLSMIAAASTAFAALLTLAALLSACGLAASFLFAGSSFAAPRPVGATRPKLHWLVQMWLVYFCGVFGGLMLIGHAAPFVKVQGGGTKLAATAVMFVAAGNLVGSIGGGLWAQRTLARFALALPIVIAIIGIVTLVTATSAGVTLTALTAVGVAYGCLIAVIPVIVLNSVGVEGFGYSFGRIFSAWGFAGLVAPSLAGFLFDYTGNYYVALYVALAAATVALGLIATLRSS